MDNEITGSQRLRITVTDNGDGLNESDSSKLFTSFERLDAINNVGGAGVALVITKYLIELERGAIGVERSPKKGGAFGEGLVLSKYSKKKQRL